jgi:PAS domain S-box-containing protein
MDLMRAQFKSFVESEATLRHERTRATIQATRLAVGSGLVAALLLGVILSLFIKRQLITVSSSYQQALLAEQEQRQWLSTTLTSIGDAVIVTDGDGQITLINNVAESITGWRMAEGLGHPLPEIFRIINEATRTEVESPVTKVLQFGQVVGLTNHTLLIARDGREIPIDDSAAPIKDPEGNIIGVVLVFRDITERKQAHAELIESEERLHRAIAESPFPTIIHDEDDRILIVSRGWTHFSGYTQEDIPTITQWTERAYGKKQAYMKDYIDRLLEINETVANGEWPVRAKDGRERIWEFFTTPLGKSASGRRLLLSIAIDVTARKQGEEEREGLLLEANEANRLRDEFLATASHELRTPLTAVVGWSRLLRTGKLDPENRERALEAIERNANQQTKLIEDLLDISRIITGKLAIQSAPIEMAPVINDSVNTVRPAADAKNVTIQTRIDSQAGPVLGDANRLQQVVWNLLSNAVKFTPQGGQVVVALRSIDSHIEITVRDTGDGIGPEFLPYVFDRFRQADGKTTRQHGGLGLGLAIVRHLVELHGGTVKAQSEGEGRGSIFSFQLPLLGIGSSPRGESSSAAVAPQDDTTSEKLSLECPPKLDGVRVLIVDDDHDTRQMLNAVLSQCEAEVITAASASEALREIELQKPDVLVSDLGMPGRDGYELIKKVREMESERAAKATPALALTAYAKAEDRVRALASGYQVHLSKPVEPAEFVLVVANLVGRGESEK